MKWKIYYDDGSTYSGITFPFYAQGLGVICVLDFHNGQWHIHEGEDFYVWNFTEDGWTGVDMIGLFDYLQMKGVKKVIIGRTVDNDLFDKIKKHALEDMYRLSE